MSVTRSTAPHPLIQRFLRDGGGTSAVEFSLVSLPFILLLLFILQIGVYYMTKSSLDTGTLETADSLVNTFNSGSSSNPIANSSLPTAAQLKSTVISNSGGLIRSASTSVEIQPFANLSAAVVPITDGTTNYGLVGSTTVLALRTKSTVPGFLPGLSSLAVYSSVLVRRQGY